MSRINDMSVSSRFVDLQDIEKNGGATFKLQDKEITENGVVIADPTYDGLSKVDVNVSGGGIDLEDNKEATIDVSTYTEPVEVTPTAGKDGMKKATITLSNIPSGGDIEANKEATIDVSTYTEPVEITPTEGKDGMKKATVTLDNIPSGSDDAPYFIQCSNDSGNIPILIVPDITKLSIFITNLSTNLAILSSDENRVGWHSSSDFDFESDNVGDNGISLAGYSVYGIYTYNLDIYPSSLKYDGQLYNFPQDLNHVTKNPCIPINSQASTPTSDTPSGTVTSGTIVNLSTTETDGTIYCSIDGSDFIEYYSQGIEIIETCTVRAVTAVSNKAVSEELVLNFTVE